MTTNQDIYSMEFVANDYFQAALCQSVDFAETEN